jgi:hypothetical protein
VIPQKLRNREFNTTAKTAGKSRKKWKSYCGKTVLEVGLQVFLVHKSVYAAANRSATPNFFPVVGWVAVAPSFQQLPRIFPWKLAGKFRKNPKTTCRWKPEPEPRERIWHWIPIEEAEKGKPTFEEKFSVKCTCIYRFSKKIQTLNLTDE